MEKNISVCRCEFVQEEKYMFNVGENVILKEAIYKRQSPLSSLLYIITTVTMFGGMVFNQR